jgi:hypothetical protein
VQPALPISAARFYNVNARGISRVLATEPLVLAGANHGSPSDDEVGGYKARSARSERKRAEQSLREQLTWRARP